MEGGAVTHRAALLTSVLLGSTCTPEDTTEEVIAVVDSALGSTCDQIEPLALDLDAVTPSTKRQVVLPAGQAICYVLENPCPGWLAVDARPLGDEALQLELHEDFDMLLGRGRTVEESRSHRFELQAIHAYLDTHDPSVQVIRVSADAPDGGEDTPFSLWVAFLPRSRDCMAEPPDAGEGPHRSVSP